MLFFQAFLHFGPVNGYVFRSHRPELEEEEIRLEIQKSGFHLYDRQSASFSITSRIRYVMIAVYCALKAHDNTAWGNAPGKENRQNRSAESAKQKALFGYGLAKASHGFGCRHVSPFPGVYLNYATDPGRCPAKFQRNFGGLTCYGHSGRGPCPEYPEESVWTILDRSDLCLFCCESSPKQMGYAQ